MSIFEFFTVAVLVILFASLSLLPWVLTDSDSDMLVQTND